MAKKTFERSAFNGKDLYFHASVYRSSWYFSMGVSYDPTARKGLDLVISRFRAYSALAFVQALNDVETEMAKATNLPEEAPTMSDDAVRKPYPSECITFAYEDNSPYAYLVAKGQNGESDRILCVLTYNDIKDLKASAIEYAKAFKILGLDKVVTADH